MKISIFLNIFIINKCFSIENDMYRGRNRNLLQIFKIQESEIRQNKIFEESRRFEEHNFRRQEIHFLYFYDRDIFEFYDNNTRVTGICGDIWTLLANYLNFTMIFKRTHVRTLGVQHEPHENYTGLLGMMQRNEGTIIPVMEAFIPRLEVLDFTLPLWKTKHRMFIKCYHQYKRTWMLDLFSWQIWCLIIVIYVLLSILSILARHVIGEEPASRSLQLASSPTDYFFYNFGALCNQGDVLYLVQKNFKIQSFCMSMFSWLLLTSFSSQLIIYVTQTILVPPFESLETLINDTDYILLSEKNSVVYITFEQNYRPIYSYIKENNRIQFYTNYNYMWDLACSDENNYVMFQSEFIKMNNMKCDLDPVGKAYIKTWIVAGVTKNFTYKKTIDISLMKLHEFGIISLLKDRWLKNKDSQENIDIYYSPISLDQVSLLISIYVFGLCSSITLVFIENAVYSYSLKMK